MTLMDGFMGGGQTAARRMLVYVLVDTSSSMSGAPIQAVNEGLDMLNRELSNTPEAVEMMHISVISFESNARVEVPLTPITQFAPPRLSTGGSTNMTAALSLVHSEIDKHFRPNQGGAVRGDYKPNLFLLTDGMPDDLPSAIREGQRLQRRPAGHSIGTFLALGCGPYVEASNLQQIAKSVALMHTMTPENLRAFFQWMSASLSGASQRASRAANDPNADGGTAEAVPVPQNAQGQAAFQFEF
jgi:uncharacterized protein YegL